LVTTAKRLARSLTFGSRRPVSVTFLPFRTGLLPLFFQELLMVFLSPVKARCRRYLRQNPPAEPALLLKSVFKGKGLRPLLNPMRKPKA